MQMQGKRFKKLIRITSFQAIKRGNWLIKFSTTDQDSIMVVCQSVSNPNNIFVKFFLDENQAISFIDFLIEQSNFQIENEQDPNL